MNEARALNVVNEHDLLSKVTNDIYYNQELKQVFPEVATALGIPLKRTDCINCFGEALALLKSKYKTPQKMQIDYTYRLYQPQAGFPSTGLPFPTTDDECRDFLRQKPNMIKFFVKYPENWEQDIQGAQQVETPPPAPTVQDFNQDLSIAQPIEDTPIPEVYAPSINTDALEQEVKKNQG